MPVKLSSVKANLEREDTGDWVEIPEWPGVALLVRSVETPSYRVKRDQMARKFAQRFQDKPVPPQELDAGNGRLAAEELLRGWRGFDEEYTPELAAEMLPLPEWRELARNTIWAATKLATISAEFVEDTAKN